MSLLQLLPYKEYKKVLCLTQEQCEKIARLADLSRLTFDMDKPGEKLIKTLDRTGCTLQKFMQLMSSLYVKSVTIYNKPHSKVAILISNDRYKYLSKLATPSVDCEALAEKLGKLGFIPITIRNTESIVLKEILVKIFNLIEHDSYCFIFYAGHGCQLCNTKCMLGIDSPIEDIQMEHCVTENFVLKEAEKCKLDLCIFIMDMCRIYLDRETNPQIYSLITTVEDYTINKNLLVTYSAQSSQSAYEELEIEFSSSIDNNVTYELKPGDTERIVPCASLYVKALCEHLEDDLDVSSMLDIVHKDVEMSIRKQKPIKVQCGSDKRSLYDPCTGNTESIKEKLKEVLHKYSNYCEVR